MKVGDKLECIDAKEIGIPLKEGEIYTCIKVFRGNQREDEETIEEYISEPGCCLKEVQGHFLQKRFKVLYSKGSMP